MKRKSVLLAAVAFLLVLGLRVSPAWSYFTDSTYANGGLPITVKPTTTVTETYGNRTKHVVVHNTGEYAVLVRARVYTSLDTTVTSGEWEGTPGDWYYYGSESAPTVLEPGEDTAELTVAINFPEGATEDSSYNVIVVYEAVPVQYDEDGNVVADWAFALDRRTSEGGN